MRGGGGGKWSLHHADNAGGGRGMQAEGVERFNEASLPVGWREGDGGKGVLFVVMKRTCVRGRGSRGSVAVLCANNTFCPQVRCQVAYRVSNRLNQSPVLDVGMGWEPQQKQ